MDKLEASALKDATPDELIRFRVGPDHHLHSSQGAIPSCGQERALLHDKKGVHNSYQSPDSINEIDWSLKAKQGCLTIAVDLIAPQVAPGFRIATAEGVREALQFQEGNQPGVV